MRYTTTINNVKCMEWGLTLPEAFVFAWLYELPSWAKNAAIDGNVWYFASRRKACEELPLVTDREDTMYRHYKNLEEKGLIQQKKIDGNDYILLTEKAKEWNEHNPKPGIKSEDSEKNPAELGKISENDNVIPYSIDNDTKNNRERTRTKKMFVKPNLPEVVVEFGKKGLGELEAQKFFYHYESNGWMVGKTPMKNWTAAVAQWIARNNEWGGRAAAPTAPRVSHIKPEDNEW